MTQKGVFVLHRHAYTSIVLLKTMGNFMYMEKKTSGLAFGLWLFDFLFLFAFAPFSLQIKSITKQLIICRFHLSSLISRDII